MVTLVYISLLLFRPQWEDVSPNLPHGVLKTRASTAGLTLQVVGSHKALYALSLNAGVWRSDNGGPWHQLPESSRNATCIAVDPTNSNHLVVGERNGFAIDMKTNRCGVQESFDSGNHWRYTFDPLSTQKATSQVVPAVAFDPTGNLYIGTANCIGVRRRNHRTFDFSGSPIGTGLVTAISATSHAVWARTVTQLLVSSNAGASWSVLSIPSRIGEDKVSFSSRGDAFSLAATPNLVVMPCILSPGKRDNRNSVLIYNIESKEWRTATLASGNGTGLGGRRFTKAYADNLLYGAGQEIHQAKVNDRPSDANLPIPFDQPVQTNWGGPYGSPPHDIHSDTWDMHLDPGFGISNNHAWIACDGGVFTASAELRKANIDPNQLFNHRWLPFNDGLHTHHVHTITALEMPGAFARLAYPTSDNDAFYFDPKLGWMNEAWLGDVNWTLGDVGNPNLALMVRRSSGFAMLTAFHQGFPEGSQVGEDEAFTISNDEHYDGPTSLSVIQTNSDEKLDYPLLDAVRLVDLPLKTYDGAGKLQEVPGPLGEGPKRTVLIRNRAFAASPDANRTKYSGWTLERDSIPLGTTAFWTSGGHTNPTYYAYGSGHLYRSRRSGWETLPNISSGKSFEILEGNQFGPAFVNPFDPDILLVLAKDGVKTSHDGGASFTDDTSLTKLITENGKYPIMVGELTGNGRGVILATRSNASATLGQVAFDRHHPGIMAACSPFTGVMISNGSGHWTSIRHALPSPLPAIVSISIANDAIYCATEGRGVLRIPNYRQFIMAK